MKDRRWVHLAGVPPLRSILVDGHFDVLEAIQNIVLDHNGRFCKMRSEEVLFGDTDASLDSTDCDVVEKFIEELIRAAFVRFKKGH